MVKKRILLFLLISTSLASLSAAQNGISRALKQPGVNFDNENERAAVVRKVQVEEKKKEKEVALKAKALGLPMKVKKGKKEYRLIGFNGNKPRYETERMIRAAISSNARVLQTSPYALDGSGWTVGIWEGGVPRVTHQEFNAGGTARVTVLDASTNVSDHATHVTGIMGSAGVDPEARGIANAVTVHSYNTGNLYSELSNRSASSSGQQASRIFLSNHSYGITDGWGTDKRWRGVGSDQNAYSPDFGLYSNLCVSIDDIVVNNPYHLLFWAAGNERGSQPTNGDEVELNGNTVVYNSAIHPASNTAYKNGYDTVPGRALAKNLVAVGAVNDAVTGTVRNPDSGTVASFSSWGPADDGRIKPDLVANGVSVYSTVDGNDSDYTSLQGTSMSSPNACGTAALIVQQYGLLFPGSAMRASTLKGLLIHTADDIGRDGPDYIYGWGLINGKEAVDLLIEHEANPLKQNLTEDQISNTTTSKNYTFEWDGLSAIKATICWTDPSAPANSNHEDRTPDLVNDLNIKIIAPDNTEYFPFVMPYVGDWTDAKLDDPAVTGVNDVDNVEQVLINAPGQAGTWRVEVSYAGVLTNNLQDYGLILSGAAGLSPNSLRVASPNDGESIAVNSSHDITWVSNVSGNVKIDLYKGGAFDSTLSASEVDDGIYTWNVNANTTIGDDYTIRISSVDNPTNFDTSDVDFSIIPLTSLEIALDTSGVTWTSSGISDWFQQSEFTHDGVDAAQSGGINDAQSTSMEASFQGPGTLTFWWKVSSERSYDLLRVYLNNSERRRISGEQDWALNTVAIPAGNNVVRWTYNKDGSIGQGEDAGWVDQVVYTPDGVDSIVVSETGDSTDVTEGGNTDAYSVVLASEPTAGVTVNISPDSQVNASSTNLSFDATNWSIPQTVTVTAIDDANVENSPHLGVISHSSTSSDALYNNLNINNVSAQVTDNDNTPPLVNAGDDQSVIIGAGGAWSPTTLSPKLWLDASDQSTITLNGSTVSQWKDKSGFNRNATQNTAGNQPTATPGTLNGKQVLTFDGNSDLFEVDLDFLAGTSHSAFIVTKTTNYSNIYGAANADQASGSLHIGFLNSSRFRMNYWGNDWNGSIGTSFNAGSANILNYEWIEGAKKEIFTNGTSQGSDDNPIPGTIAAMSGGGRIGRVTGHTHYGGDIAEIIMVDQALSQTARESLEGYLAHKWGLVGSLPVVHPHRNSAPNGSSTTANLNGTVSDPDGQPLTAVWSLVNGPAAVSFENANSVDTTVTFTTPGVYTLRLTVNDGTTEVSNDVIIIVQTIYNAWAAGTFTNNFGDTSEMNDPDGDLLTSSQEFAFGMDPTDPTMSPMAYQKNGDVLQPGLPIVEIEYAPSGQVADMWAVFIRRKDYTAAGLTYDVHFSADMEKWTTSLVTPTRLTGENSNGDLEAVGIVFPASVPLETSGSAAPKFFRVKTTQD